MKALKRTSDVLLAALSECDLVSKEKQNSTIRAGTTETTVTLLHYNPPILYIVITRSPGLS